MVPPGCLGLQQRVAFGKKEIFHSLMVRPWASPWLAPVSISFIRKMELICFLFGNYWAEATQGRGIQQRVTSSTCPHHALYRAWRNTHLPAPMSHWPMVSSEPQIWMNQNQCL